MTGNAILDRVIWKDLSEDMSPEKRLVYRECVILQKRKQELKKAK